MKRILFAAILFMTVLHLSAQLKYPVSKKTDQTDDYFGTKVSDPYRWLENDNSDETKAWVKDQNAVTFSYLNQIPYRDGFKKRLETVINYAKYSSPQKKGEWFYFYKNDGLQNQSVLYRQKGLDGKPEVVIDPNKLSPDGTTRLIGFSLSKNGHYAAWGISKGGSDWQTYFIRDMQTGKDLSDEIDWVKVSGIAWQGDGFYYSRYPATEKGKELSTKNENHQVWFHKAGTLQSDDQLIFEDRANPQRFHTVGTSDDERFVYLVISDRGKGLDGNAVWYIDNKSADKTFKPIVKEVGKYMYNVIDNVADKIFIETNEDAQNSRLVEFDAAHPEQKKWKTIISEKA